MSSSVKMLKKQLTKYGKQVVFETTKLLSEKYKFSQEEALLYILPHSPPKKRKRCEAPFSELIIASVLSNTSQTNFPLDYSRIIASSEQLEEYKCDMAKRSPKVLNDWFRKCKLHSMCFQKQLGLYKDDHNITCYLTGKTIKEPTILELVRDVEKKQRKADIYISVDTMPHHSTVTKWIGLSVKTTPNDPMSNWSVEKLISEVDKKTATKLKETKVKLLEDNGITRDWRENKEENRKKYNEIMYGYNEYKTMLHMWMTEPKNKEYIQKIIAEAAGSSITRFEMFKYDGNKFTNLSEIYQKIIKSKNFNIIVDSSNTKSHLEKLKLKPHHSITSAKLWYYIQIDSIVEYRIEIRWKGDPFASPQILLIGYN